MWFKISVLNLVRESENSRKKFENATRLNESNESESKVNYYC